MRPWAPFVVLLAAVPAAWAEKYEIDDPVPPGASGKVLPLSGKILAIKALASGVAGTAAALGAALEDLEAKVTDLEIKIELSADVLFDFGQADLRPEAAPALDKAATVLKAYPAARTTIDGHTDSKGDDHYNQRLSERRADSVRAWLAAHGVTNPVATRGWGETKPIVPNADAKGRDDPDGRQRNRRVEITVRKG